VSHDSVTWLDYSQVAERLGVSPGKVRRLVQERALLAMRVDGTFKVPELFLDDAVKGELRGTATLLIDGGFSEEEALEWFLRPDDTLGTSPIDAIAQGRKREVRRLAQSLAL
jgi:excisionase family DNA binding protein